MRSAVPSLVDVLAELAGEIGGELIELLRNSSVRKRFRDAGGGLVVITPTPFHWEPLPPEQRPRQNRLRDRYGEFASLVDVILARQPVSVSAEVKGNHETVLRVVNQDEAMSATSVEENLQSALSALRQNLSLVNQRAMGARDELVVVPDTNALYACPSLEEWVFQDFDKFVIALVPTVVGELDRHKDTHPNPEVRKKADRLNRQIGEYRRRGRLVDGVPLRRDRSRIRSWACEPNLALALQWLERDRPDDRLLASAMELARDSALSPTAIVTLDLNLQNKCEFARMPFLLPPKLENAPIQMERNASGS